MRLHKCKKVLIFLVEEKLVDEMDDWKPFSALFER